ncbi:MAG: HipA domain-containing protein [Bdellovibrionaceae bacterium]|nr:HipA domain-containing protein [Pseudobdellovibrionaceae bacterium]
MGAIVSGTSGAQGEAPKFLLVEDQSGRWHGDGAIADDQIKNSWLVKFPRGKKKRDYQILKAEGAYYEIARALGIRTYGPLDWEDDTLFIPRFDREITKNKLTRFGLESIVSAHGIPEFAARIRHNEYLDTIKKYSTNPKTEIKEYVFRDFINIVCGNTDNHGRNTAFIKKPNDVIEISPLFDFPPMALDDSGIARVSRWADEDSQIPSFKAIAEKLTVLGIKQDEALVFFADVEERLANVPTLFKKFNIDTEVAMLATRKFDDFMIALRNFRREK